MPNSIAIYNIAMPDGSTLHFISEQLSDKQIEKIQSIIDETETVLGEYDKFIDIASAKISEKLGIDMQFCVTGYVFRKRR